MPRPQGAKNKPKTISELAELIKQAAEAEGLNPADIFANSDGAPSEVDAAAAEAARREKVSKFQSLEIELDPEEVDTFKCGACGAVMATEMKHCPECGAELNW